MILSRLSLVSLLTNERVASNQASYVGDYILLYAIRYLLDTENKRRDQLQAGRSVDEFGFVEKVDEGGHVSRRKVDKGLLDLTDRQNMAFRYSL